MNKLLKYILIGIGITSVSIASVKAESYTEDYTSNNVTIQMSSRTYPLANSNYPKYLCIVPTSSYLALYGDSAYNNYIGGIALGTIYCSNDQYIYLRNNNGNGNVSFFYYDAKENYTSLQCQTEYNLIPISEVTANYCRLNFNLIDPASCPIQPSGTGQVSRSSLYINDTQYPGNGIIRVGIPDYIGRSITYNDDENLIDIEGYNADTEYIENVINQEKLTPTNEDFENMLVGLANFFPYLAIALLFYFLIKVVYKTFK